MAQTLDQQIRRAIKQHYGENLWTFRDDVNYKDGTKAFVADIAKVIRGELEYLSDLPDEIAKYTKASSADRAMGGAIKSLRIKKGVTQERLAKVTGLNADFLCNLENGRIAATVDLYIDAHRSLDPNKKERKEFVDHVSRYKSREAMIRDVIELYYGISLWAFRPKLSYEDAIEPFIKSLSALAHIRGREL